MPRYTDDPESQSQCHAVGSLHIRYFRPRSYDREADGEAERPIKLHLKLMIVDERHVLLGSGNMDRASWYTSEELGVAMDCRKSAAACRILVAEQLHESTTLAYDSGSSVQFETY